MITARANIVLKLLLMCLFTTALRADVLTATNTVTSLSFKLGPGYSTAGYTLQFSTYDPSTSWALYNVNYGYSGEVKPSSPTSSTYRTDYDVLSGGSKYGYGSASFTLPLTDTDSDGLADILDIKKSGNFTASGTASEYLPATGMKSYSLSGTFTRASGSNTGTYAINSSSGYSVSGTFYLTGGNGYFTYDTTYKTIRFYGDAFSLGSGGTGFTTYEILSPTSIKVDSFPYTAANNAYIWVNSFTLTRSGTRYTAKGSFEDGLEATYWDDYKDFHIVIHDLNDVDGDGVPDLADTNVFTGATIHIHPQSKTVNQGVKTNLSVTALSPYPITYQWYFNDQPLTGKTSSTLTFNSVLADQAGNYFVIVTSNGKSKTSQTAILTVNTPPSITAHPLGTNIVIGRTLTLSVGASGTPTPTYEWYRNNTLVPGQSGPIMTINAATATQGGDYFAKALNAGGNATSVVAKVTVSTGVFAKPQNVTAANIQSSGFSLDLQLENSKIYRIEYSTDLVTWQTLTTFVSNSTTKQFVDPAASGKQRRYYRLVRQ